MKLELGKLGMIALGGLSAILASACCIGPLLLISIGFGGAWVSNLQMLEHLKPAFIMVSLIAMIMAFRKIYWVDNTCTEGEICALPIAQRLYKTMLWAVMTLIMFVLMFPYAAHYFY